MNKDNVIHYNFKSNHENGAKNSSSPPTNGVNVHITRNHGTMKVVTNLSDLSEHELLWALLNDAAQTLEQRDITVAEKEAIIQDYIAN